MFLKGRTQRISISWGIFCLGAALWGIGAYKASSTLMKESALFWWQIAYIAVAFAPITFLHSVYLLLKIPKKIPLLISYGLGLITLYIIFFRKELFFGELEFVFNQFYWVYWPKSRSLAYLAFYIIFYWIILIYAFKLLLKYYILSAGVSRNQLKYFILGTTIGFLGPEMMFLSKFGINIYPYANFLIIFYPIIVGYAIIKYHLMDIKVAITRAGVFVVVYVLVLGIPFWVGFKTKSWFVSTSIMTILATLGPFIYNHLRQRAEDRLLQEDRRAQDLLTKTSEGMTMVRDLKKLLGLIVHLVSKAMKITNVSIYLLDKEMSSYTLKSVRFLKHLSLPESEPFSKENSLIQHLTRLRAPLVYEELKLKLQSNPELKSIEEELRKLSASVIIPSAP
jgi:hypothetical protein